MLHGIKLLELAERASELFSEISSDDKRQLLKTVLLNPRLNGTTVEYEHKKTFSMFEKGIEIEKWRDRREMTQPFNIT